jgi:DNA-binding CsgD family transcriptional regulator
VNTVFDRESSPCDCVQQISFRNGRPLAPHSRLIQIESWREIGIENLVCLFSRQDWEFQFTFSGNPKPAHTAVSRSLKWYHWQCRYLTVLKSLKQNWSAPSARTKNCEADLTRKQKQSVALPSKQTPLLPECYVLCERSSGAVRLRVEADSDGGLPLDKIAALLAVQCLVRGKTPEEYELMVITRESLLHSVAERAQQILSAGRALGAGVRVSRREQEVLDGVLQYFTNKEIASKLHLSERTVKFHVSSLLSKFGVSNRAALTREASLGRMPASILAGHLQAPISIEYEVGGRESKDEIVPPPAQCSIAAQSPRSRSRVFPMVSNSRLAN